jgi:hypothetical protein
MYVVLPPGAALHEDIIVIKSIECSDNSTCRRIV